MTNCLITASQVKDINLIKQKTFKTMYKLDAIGEDNINYQHSWWVWAELFKGMTEPLTTLSLHQYVIRYTGVWLQLKVSPLLDSVKISTGEVNANFPVINEMHGALNELNHCSLIVLISQVEGTNSDTSDSNS